MKHYFHQLKWDLKTIMWPLITLFILIALFVGIEAWRFADSFSRANDDASLYLRVAIISISTIALIMVILKDPPFGKQEFWLTKPINKIAVAASKITVLFVVIILTGTISTLPLVFSENGHLVRAFFFEHLIFFSPIFFVSSLLSAISARIEKLLLNSFILLVIFTGLASLFAFLDPLHNIEKNRSALESAFFLIAILSSASSVFILVWTYMRRSARGTLVLTSLLVAICAGILTFWNTTLNENTMSSAQVKKTGWDKLQVEIATHLKDGSSPHDRINFSPTYTYSSIFAPHFPMKIRKIPKGKAIGRISFKGQLSTHDRKWPIRESSNNNPIDNSWIPQGLLPNYRPAPFSYANFEEKIDPSKPQSFQPEDIVLYHITKNDLESIEGKEFNYQGVAKIEALNLVQQFEIPYGIDHTLFVSGCHYKIDFKKHLIDIKSEFAKTQFLSSYSGTSSFLVFIINKKRNEFIRLNSSNSSENSSLGTTRRESQFYFRSKFGYSRDSYKNLQEWFNESHIRVYRAFSEGNINITVDLKKVRPE